MSDSTVFLAKQNLRDGLAALTGRHAPTDDALARAAASLRQALEHLDAEITAREVHRAKQRRHGIEVANGTALVDVRGRRRSPVTLPGYHKGRTPGNKGRRYPPTPPSVEEIIRMLGHCGTDPYGERLRALIFILWRAGLRIGEALALQEHDLDRDQGTIDVRCGKGGKPRTVGIDDWVWPQLEPWLRYRQDIPVGALFCVIEGPTAGRPWRDTGVRVYLRRLADKAGIRKRVAPHQLRHALAVQMLEEDVNVLFIQRQLGHQNLGITTTYFNGLPQKKLYDAVRSRPVPRVNALSLIGGKP